VKFLDSAALNQAMCCQTNQLTSPKTHVTLIVATVFDQNCNSLKFMPLSFPYSSCRTPFHICNAHEHSFHCVFHMWHFTTRNNRTEWMTAYCRGQVQ